MTSAFSAVRSGEGLATVALTWMVSPARLVLAASTVRVVVGRGVARGVSSWVAAIANGSPVGPSTCPAATLYTTGPGEGDFTCSTLSTVLALVLCRAPVAASYSARSRLLSV